MGLPRLPAAFAIALAMVVVAVGTTGAHAQFGMPGGMTPDKVPPAVASDIPFVKCQVCQLVIKEAARLTEDLRKETAAKPGKKVRARTAPPGCRRRRLLLPRAHAHTRAPPKKNPV